MTLPFRSLLVTAAILVMLHPPAAAQQTAPLTNAQIERFLTSFDAMLTMVTKYWGDRRFTPKGIIMPARGTIERAMAEMEAEGTLQDFNRLFTSQGFDGYDAWRHVGQRIANAQFQIRATDQGNPIVPLSPSRYATIKRLREKFSKPDPQIPEAVRQEKYRGLGEALAEHDKWQWALRDMTVVEPYLPRMVELGRKRQTAARAARKRQ